MQELLYTSHQGAGLRKGTGGGFCTVLSTEGMASNLAMAMEKLSGYRHPFDIHDTRSSSNPINYRHAVLRIGGISYHVLSRVADYRFEHTGRSNKLAYHVALAKNELPACGPAELCQVPGFLRNEWDGKVRLEAARAPISIPATVKPGPCHAWQKVAGDAGWAGVVAEHVLSSPNVPISIVFPLRTDTLALITDVFSLIPPQKRWDYSFSTFFTTLNAGTSCHIRFLLAETPEADKLLRDKREKVIDLTVPLPKAPPAELVISARTGNLTHAQPNKTSARHPSPKSLVTAEELIDITLDDLYENNGSEPLFGGPMPPPAHRDITDSRNTRPRAGKASKSPKRDANRGIKVAAMVMAGIAVFGLLLTVVGAGAFFAGTLWKPVQPLTNQDAKLPANSGMTAGSSAPPPAPPSAGTNLPIPNGPPVDPQPSVDNDRKADPVSAADPSPENIEQPNNEPASKKESDSQEPNSEVGEEKDNDDQSDGDPSRTFADTDTNTKSFTVPEVLNLPEYEGTATDPVDLLEAAPGSTIDNLKFEYVKEIRDDVAGLRGISSSGKSGKINISTPRYPTVANFTVKDNKIAFHWNEIKSDQAIELRGIRLLGNGLRWCQLSFEVDGKSHTCRLSNARMQPNVEFQQVPGAGIGIYVADLTSALESRTPRLGSLEIQGAPKLVDDKVFAPLSRMNQGFETFASVSGKGDSGAEHQVQILRMRMVMKTEQNGDLRLEIELKMRAEGELLYPQRKSSWESPSVKSIESVKTTVDTMLDNLALEIDKNERSLNAAKKKLSDDPGNEKLKNEEASLSMAKVNFERQKSYVSEVQGLFKHLGAIVDESRKILLTDFRLQLHYDRLASPQSENIPLTADLLVVGSPDEIPAGKNEDGTSSSPPGVGDGVQPQAKVTQPPPPKP